MINNYLKQVEEAISPRHYTYQDIQQYKKEENYTNFNSPQMSNQAIPSAHLNKRKMEI